MSDLMFRPVTELAELVRSGEVSARELVGASLERIEALNGEINAFVHVDEEGALAAADAVTPGDDAPFAGVPIAIKDNKPVAGMPLTFGSSFFGDFVAGHDAYMVRRLREAGFVIVGKTNLPEFGILPVSEPTRFGPARNPWDTGRTPGGSSGGAAAAVAAGMVPIAHGNDGGGSTRIPAACCGLVGLKPQRGRISLGPDVGEAFLVADGVLTRTTEETALLLDILAGYEVGDATWAPPPEEPFAATAGREPKPLRIALTLDPPLEGAQIDPVCAAAARDAGELLASLGHEVEEVTPPWALPGLLELFTAAFGPAVSMTILFASMIREREPAAEDVEALSWYIWNESKALDAPHYLGAVAQLQGVARSLIAFHETYDLILTPTLAERPAPIGEIDGAGPDPRATFRRSGQFTPFTALANVTGQPAISVPLAHGEDGLPTGIQLFGPPLGEGLLLSVAAQLEAARPWADRRPALATA